MGCTHYSTNQAIAVSALASQWISLQDEIQAYYVGVESDVHSVLGQTGSNPRRQTSTTQGYKSWSHGMTNVSIPEVNMLKSSSKLAVSVPLYLSVNLGFVSVNGPRET